MDNYYNSAATFCLLGLLVFMDTSAMQYWISQGPAASTVRSIAVSQWSGLHGPFRCFPSKRHRAPLGEAENAYTSAIDLIKCTYSSSGLLPGRTCSILEKIDGQCISVSVGGQGEMIGGGTTHSKPPSLHRPASSPAGPVANQSKQPPSWSGMPLSGPRFGSDEDAAALSGDHLPVGASGLDAKDDILTLCLERLTWHPDKDHSR